jgi:hypothetical protein
MPTLDEIGKRLGLTRAEQDFLIRLVDEKRPRRAAARSRKARSGTASSARTTKESAARKSRAMSPETRELIVEKGDRARKSA